MCIFFIRFKFSDWFWSKVFFFVFFIFWCFLEEYRMFYLWCFCGSSSYSFFPACVVSSRKLGFIFNEISCDLFVVFSFSVFSVLSQFLYFIGIRWRMNVDGWWFCFFFGMWQVFLSRGTDISLKNCWLYYVTLLSSNLSRLHIMLQSLNCITIISFMNFYLIFGWR